MIRWKKTKWELTRDTFLGVLLKFALAGFFGLVVVASLDQLEKRSEQRKTLKEMNQEIERFENGARPHQLSDRSKRFRSEILEGRRAKAQQKLRGVWLLDDHFRLEPTYGVQLSVTGTEHLVFHDDGKYSSYGDNVFQFSSEKDEINIRIVMYERGSYESTGSSINFSPEFILSNIHPDSKSYRQLKAQIAVLSDEAPELLSVMAGAFWDDFSGPDLYESETEQIVKLTQDKLKVTIALEGDVLLADGTPLRDHVYDYRRFSDEPQYAFPEEYDVLKAHKKN